MTVSKFNKTQSQCPLNELVTLCSLNNAVYRRRETTQHRDQLSTGKTCNFQVKTILQTVARTLRHIHNVSGTHRVRSNQCNFRQYYLVLKMLILGIF